jgi:ATPases with chaperone activity, ATP-binding subunit
MKLQFSEELNLILNYAKEEAVRLGNLIISTDHVILGFLRHNNNLPVEIMRRFSVDLDELKLFLENNLKASEPIKEDQIHLINTSEACQNAIRITFLEAKSLKYQGNPLSIHLFLSILRSEGGYSVNIFSRYDVVYSIIRRFYQDHYLKTAEDVMEDYREEKNNEDDRNALFGYKDKVDKDFKKKGSTPFLDSFGYDITKAAAAGKIDSVVGRDKEIERLAQILGRMKKNNPVLIGEPGVGKTAIAEGLAIKIVNKQVSSVLLNKRLVSLDLGSLVAGTQYRGQFEERIKAVLEEINKNKNIILFIDEMHTLIGAGSSIGL